MPLLQRQRQHAALQSRTAQHPLRHHRTAANLAQRLAGRPLQLHGRLHSMLRTVAQRTVGGQHVDAVRVALHHKRADRVVGIAAPVGRHGLRKHHEQVGRRGAGHALLGSVHLPQGGLPDDQWKLAFGFQQNTI